MLRNGIAQSRPALGGLVSSMSPSVIIAPAKANRPYIMGSVVVGVTPTPSKDSAKVFVGQPTGDQKIQGVMALGMAQIQQRGEKGFVREGFNADYNNIGTKGAFWCALDLQHFDKAKVDALQGNGVVSVDKNGVLSFGESAPQGNDAGGAAENNVVISNAEAVVLNYFDSPIIPAIDETISVGATQHIFKYPKGIGAILVIIK